MEQEPFDVFLSFKNTDASGAATVDSQIARECYDFLTSRGLRVFCSLVTLEETGTASYTRAIDDALDQVNVLVAIGTSRENLDSNWVRYEWDSFFNDVRAGIKPDGRVFVYLQGIGPNELPRALRHNQVIQNGPGQLEKLYRFIAKEGAVPAAPVRQIQEVGRADDDVDEVDAATREAGGLLAKGERRLAVTKVSELVKRLRARKDPAGEVRARVALANLLAEIPGELGAAIDVARRAEQIAKFAGLASSATDCARTIEALNGRALAARHTARTDWISAILEQDRVNQSKLGYQTSDHGSPANDLVRQLRRLEGAWEWVSEDSKFPVDAYARMIGGRLWMPYSYGEPRQLASMFYGFRPGASGWISEFRWFDASTRGIAVWKFSDADHIDGQWWLAGQVLSQIAGGLPQAQGTRFLPVRANSKPTPRWAEGVFEELTLQLTSRQ